MATAQPGRRARPASRASGARRSCRAAGPIAAPASAPPTVPTAARPGHPDTTGHRTAAGRPGRSNRPDGRRARARRTARVPRRDRGGPPPHRGGGPPPYRGGPPAPRGGPPPYRAGPPPYRGDPARDRGGPGPDRPPWRPDRPGGPPADRPWQRPGPGAGPWPRPADSLPAPDLLGPDEELVAGRRPVEEVFAAGRTALRLLVVPQRRNALEQLVLHATRLRIPIVEVEGGSLTAIAGFDGHQGVAIVVEPREFATLGDILARAEERGEPPFVLVLDSLEDPQNVGTLLRSAEAAGVHGILFPTRRQAPLSPAAVKASAGAVEHLLLCPVDDLAGALADLHAKGLRVAGSEADAPLTARQTDLRGPLAIVIGSEGQGLGPAVRKRCDLFMRIPMRGSIGSLNAAVAGSILLFEAVAQRDPNGRARPTTRRGRGRGADVPEGEEGARGRRSIRGPTADADVRDRGARVRPAARRSRAIRHARTRRPADRPADGLNAPRLTHRTGRPYHSPAPMGSSAV